MQTLDPKDLIHLALRLAAQVRQRRQQRARADVLQVLERAVHRQSQLQADERRLVKALARGWHRAVRQLIVAGRFLRDEVLSDLRACNQALEAFAEPQHGCLTASEMLEELTSVGEEFDGMDSEKGELWITTEPIVLEDVRLGRFEIRLNLERVGATTGQRDFELRALEPHPARSSEAVTHPHVSGGALCAGDGASAIRHALERGRLCDFFQIVHAVLTTYNPDNAFVTLEHWEGRPCDECGDLVGPDDLCGCDGCSGDFCLDCMGSCNACSGNCCPSCLSPCRGCGAAACSGCLSSCEACGEEGYCAGCLDDGLCSTCTQEKENDDDSSTVSTLDDAATGSRGGKPTALPTAGADLQPGGVDQAAVLLPPR